MVFVTDADISGASGPNHSPQSIALLQRALETKVLDPNTIVKQPCAPTAGLSRCTSISTVTSVRCPNSHCSGAIGRS